MIVVLILLVASGAAAWSYWPRGDGGNKGPATAEVTRRDLVSSVLATGAVKPQVGAEVRVGARISGKVEHLYANIGDMVKKGKSQAEAEQGIDTLCALIGWADRATLKLGQGGDSTAAELRLSFRKP